MEFSRSGIILCTENYSQCVRFYSQSLGLQILFSLDNENSTLTCCDLGNGHYLMIEKGGKAVEGMKSLDQNPVWLRFNVQDVESTATELSNKGIETRVRREPWGTVADFVDPDGNVCSLRDEGTFGE